MKRDIGPYTIELTGDLITINTKESGTIWGNTYPTAQARKQFVQLCEKLERRVYNQSN